MEGLKEIRAKFEKGEISQDDMDIETQKALAKMYKDEIQNSMDRIIQLKKETREFDQKIKELDEVEKKLDAESEAE